MTDKQSCQELPNDEAQERHRTDSLLVQQERISKRVIKPPLRRIFRELWYQRTVTLLFGIAILFVVIRTALLSTSELFPGGARIGEVLFELAIAYIGAWIFNVLVVILPRLRARDGVLEGAGQVIQRLGAIGLRMRTDLGLRHDPQQLDLELDSLASTLKGILENLPLTDNAPLMVPEGAGVRYATWFEWTILKVREVESLNALLVPYLPYMEIELIWRINKVVLSQFVVMGRIMAGVPVGRGFMIVFHSFLPEFLIACENLRTYYEQNLPMKPDRGQGG